MEVRTSRSAAGLAAAVLAVAGAGALLFFALRAPSSPRGTARGAAAPAGGDETAEHVLVPSGAGEGEERRESDAATAEDAVDATPGLRAGSEDAAERIAAEQELVEAAPAGRDAVLALLEDPAFLEACRDPASAEPQLLSDLASKARRVLGTFQTEECARRVAAGLYERLEGYVPGEPFTTRGGKRGELVSFSSDGSEFRRVVFSPEEYPELHRLREQIERLESGLRAVRRGGR